MIIIYFKYGTLTLLFGYHKPQVDMYNHDFEWDSVCVTRIFFYYCRSITEMLHIK